jgi:rRNA processing protein Gar1
MDLRCEILNVRGKDVTIRLNDCVKMNSKIYDNTGRMVGKIVRIFGPVTSAYGLVSIFPSSDEVKELYVRCVGDLNGRGKAREEKN